MKEYFLVFFDEYTGMNFGDGIVKEQYSNLYDAVCAATEKNSKLFDNHDMAYVELQSNISHYDVRIIEDGKQINFCPFANKDFFFIPYYW
mgnify:CR=1 FL=1